MSKNATPGRKESNSSVWVVILLAIVLVSIMLLSVAGGSIFRSISSNRSSNMNTRGALSYVSARVLSSDETGSVKAEDAGEGSVLTLKKGDKSSALFLKGGYLCEGKDLDDADARKIARTSKFTVSMDGNMLTVTTDEGSREIYLHSAGDDSDTAGTTDAGAASDASDDTEAAGEKAGASGEADAAETEAAEAADAAETEEAGS